MCHSLGPGAKCPITDHAPGRQLPGSTDAASVARVRLGSRRVRSPGPAQIHYRPKSRYDHECHNPGPAATLAESRWPLRGKPPGSFPSRAERVLKTHTLRGTLLPVLSAPFRTVRQLREAGAGQGRGHGTRPPGATGRLLRLGARAWCWLHMAMPTSWATTWRGLVRPRSVAVTPTLFQTRRRCGTAGSCCRMCR